MALAAIYPHLYTYSTRLLIPVSPLAWFCTIPAYVS